MAYLSTYSRVIYASRWAEADRSEARHCWPRSWPASTRNNAAAGVTGFLLYREGWFLQALEGDLDAVDQAFDRIRRDRRHLDVRIVADEPAFERAFADWSMCAGHLADVPAGRAGRARPRRQLRPRAPRPAEGAGPARRRRRGPARARPRGLTPPQAGTRRAIVAAMTSALVIGLSAVIVAIRDGEAAVLTVRPKGGGAACRRPALRPVRPGGPAHLRAGAARLRRRPDRLRPRLCRAALHLRRPGPRRAAWPTSARAAAAGDLGGLSGADAPGRGRSRRPTPTGRPGRASSPGRTGGAAGRRLIDETIAPALEAWAARRAAPRPSAGVARGALAVRAGRRALERGAGAGALRAALRGGPGPRGRPRPARGRGRPAAAAAGLAAGRADDLRPPPHPGHGRSAGCAAS